MKNVRVNITMYSIKLAGNERVNPLINYLMNRIASHTTNLNLGRIV